MPYLKQTDRELTQHRGPLTEGELNYALTVVCLSYVSRVGQSYATFNDVVGALECCKAEFYRRVVAPYEDLKCEANGDVYP